MTATIPAATIPAAATAPPPVRQPGPVTTAQAVVDAIVDLGIRRSIALPDTMNVHALDALDADPRIEAIRTSTEDVGVAAMFGAWIGGEFNVALMEGSGLGLCTEILSRMIEDRVPLLILVSHSGLHGERHVYHRAPGLAGMATLRGLDIAHHVAAPGDDIPALITSVGQSAAATGRPVAIVLPVRSIVRDRPPAPRVEVEGMSDRDVARAVLALREDALVVGSPGLGSCHLVDGAPDDVTILSQVELGYATPAGWGLAMAQPGRPVVVVDGDGSLLSRPSVLADLARYRPDNLTVIVINNGGYGSFTLGRAEPQVGPTGWGVDIAALARACGLRQVSEVSSTQQLNTQLAAALREPSGPHLIVAHAPRTEIPVHPEPLRTSVLVTQAMRHYLTR